MTLSKVACVVVFFFAAIAFCVDADAAANGTSCGDLREGVYLGEYSFPSELGGTDRVLQLKAVVNLVRDIIGYHGTVAGVAFNSQIEEVLPQNSQFNLNIWAVFDEDTCTLSGAMYDFERNLIEAFEWNYDGRVISGPYALRINETVPYGALSFIELTPTFE